MKTATLLTFTLGMLVFTTASAHADIFNVNADFGGGITGTGSFTTDGTCAVCVAGSTLTTFSFTVEDDTFTLTPLSGLVYFRSSNLLSSEVFGSDSPSDWLQFTTFSGPDNVFFGDVDDAGNLFGRYTVTPAATAVPEPSSLALLLVVLGASAVALRRRLKAGAV